MARSILIKMSMLIAATGAVLVLGWPWAEPPQNVRLSSHDEPDLTGANPFPHSATPTKPDSGSPRSVPIETQVDINQSTARELETLPGIGPALAQRIIERRSSVGEFHSPEDLMSVKGLGSKRIDRLKPLIRFDRVPKG